MCFSPKAEKSILASLKAAVHACTDATIYSVCGFSGGASQADKQLVCRDLYTFTHNGHIFMTSKCLGLIFLLTTGLMDYGKSSSCISGMLTALQCFSVHLQVDLVFGILIDGAFSVVC